MSIITRFAPSPTGYLHIGSCRTALFNYLFARHHGGQFLLRIEDTDRQRSTPENTQAILDGMAWMGLTWDGEAISQFARRDRHKAVVEALLQQGRAYKCYATPEELEAMRAQATAEGRSPGYDGRWRDRDPSDSPANVAPAIRLKAPQTGTTTVCDLIQGDVSVENGELDDMVLLRADGTPTYMLSVVVDDHDMDITHVIRGDDHFTNTFRQIQIYTAMGWNIPQFAHLPLIHGPDGGKPSKRHGAVGVETYRDDGYLPEALNNYLLRLGWSHGDEEIIPMAQAIEWFTLDAVGKSPSRFDRDKLDHLNSHYIRQADNARLLGLLQDHHDAPLTALQTDRLTALMEALKERATTVVALAEGAAFLLADDGPIAPDQAAQDVLADTPEAILQGLHAALHSLTDFTADTIKSAVKTLAKQHDVKMGKVALPLRAMLTGGTSSPSIFDVAAVLGKDLCLRRITVTIENRGFCTAKETA